MHQNDEPFGKSFDKITFQNYMIICFLIRLFLLQKTKLSFHDKVKVERYKWKQWTVIILITLAFRK